MANEVSKLIDRTLTEAIIDSTVSYIGNYALAHCQGMTSITVQPTTPPTIGNYAFYNTNDCPIYVPSASYNTYLSSWPDYADRIMVVGQAKWVVTSSVCETLPSGKYTGTVIRTTEDVNPTSPTYGESTTETVVDTTVCDPSGNTFSKITQLADATTGKYIVAYDNGDGTGLALNASLIASTTSTSNGINAFDNFIDVSISDGNVSLSDEDTSATAFDYDGQYISWTDPDTETTYRLCGRSSGAAFEYSSPNHQVQPASTTYGFSFKDNSNNKLIALFTNSTSGAQKFRWDSSSSATLNGVGIYKLN